MFFNKTFCANFYTLISFIFLFHYVDFSNKFLTSIGLIIYLFNIIEVNHYAAQI